LGQAYRHICSGKSDKVRIATAVAGHPERHAEYAGANGLSVTADYASVLSNPEIDGVISCGPAYLHAEHSLAALRAGKPVLAIKPLAQSARDAMALQSAAEESGVLLALGYDRCFFPNVVEMRKRLLSGVLGTPLHAEGNFCVDRYRGFDRQNWKANPEHATPGSLADHMLYLMIETLGPVAEVHTKGRYDISDNGLADSAAVLLGMKNGTTGMLTAIGVTADYYRFQAFGSDGWLQITGSQNLVVRSADGREEILTLDNRDAVFGEVEAFADAISGGAPFPVPLRDAVHSAAVLEAMTKSAATSAPVAV